MILKLCKFVLYDNALFTKGSGKNATIHEHQSMYILRSNLCPSFPMALAAATSSIPPKHAGSNASCQLPAKNRKGTYLEVISQPCLVRREGNVPSPERHSNIDCP